MIFQISRRTILLTVVPLFGITSLILLYQTSSTPNSEAWWSNLSLPSSCPTPVATAPSTGLSLADQKKMTAGQTCLHSVATGALVDIGSEDAKVWESYKIGNSTGATTFRDDWVRAGRGGEWHGKETRFLRGIPGYSMFQNLYVQNGTMIAVSSDPTTLPEVSRVLSDMSRGTPENKFPVADETRWLVISPEEAAARFDGGHSARLIGSTIFLNDGPGAEGYLAHYFHLAAELFFGAWRVLSASPAVVAANTAMGLEFPRRTILAKGPDWKDVPGLNAWFLTTMFPMMSIEDNIQWTDRAISTNLYLFDEIVILDRWASHRHNPTAQQWNKMNADVFREIHSPSDWWAPVRESMMMTLGIENIHVKEKATVVYISRQGASKRRLTEASHNALVKELSTLPIDLHVAQMETMSKKDQMELVSKADIILGVHGNGMTNELWMKPGGAVIEIFDVGGFTRDYQLLAEPLKHEYFPIWNDKVYAWADDVPGFKLSDNFMGTNLQVSATLIKELVEKLLGPGGSVDINRKWEGGDTIPDDA
ncbi:Glycosyltransferase AER61, uncharacterised [Phaffia rhodozyma]|uniref:Glycosyltransferase AER61, uncharacterized n=1 Tax=Phaffia rhodozyma TaxID=264483 RepID=A0A0F7SUU0_PHARH|nr:Glycosyltransferase AER61, uncharacterised [Phaffia rhodozyma]